MEVRLYRPPTEEFSRFVPVAVSFDATGVSYTKRFYSFGSFELRIPCDASRADAFEKYLFIEIDRAFWGIILSLERSLDQSGSFLIVSGLDLKGLMSSRYTLPPGFSDTAQDGTAGYDVANGTTEHCMKHFVYSNFFTEASPTRGIPGFQIAPDLGRGLAEDKYMSRHELLSDVLERLGEASELGYTVEPDLMAGTITFDCAQGVNRSAEQSENPRLIFSVERRNISEMNYKNSDRNMRNLFYATLSGAQFADEAFTATYTREDMPELPSGLYRWEQHLDISATHPEAGKEYEELKRLAMVRAQSYVTEESFFANVLDVSAAHGGTYDLGDIVTVQNRAWGLSMHPRITEISVQASASGYLKTITFGRAPINPLAKLRRQMKGG